MKSLIKWIGRCFTYHSWLVDCHTSSLHLWFHVHQTFNSIKPIQPYITKKYICVGVKCKTMLPCKTMVVLIQYIINANNLSEIERIFDDRRKNWICFHFLLFKPLYYFLVDNLSLILRWLFCTKTCLEWCKDVCVFPTHKLHEELLTRRVHKASKSKRTSQNFYLKW